MKNIINVEEKVDELLLKFEQDIDKDKLIIAKTIAYAAKYINKKIEGKDDQKTRQNLENLLTHSTDYEIIKEDGSSEVISGAENIRDAFSKHYGAGVTQALDFWEKGNSKYKWIWSSKDKKWESVK